MRTQRLVPVLLGDLIYISSCEENQHRNTTYLSCLNKSDFIFIVVYIQIFHLYKYMGSAYFPNGMEIHWPGTQQI